ncbi:hypothetical protein JET14_22040 (plasmid) [Martelella lutilitoris]|uniref:Uncharacterized protein n=1 Tax=Martelella lutilitoris TaxID=2583532 RepID=A0A7T7HPW7_9HYPH|nr:hypothetical protein [Martelella lutilitoris]QQM33134.1 hypothetical protein JET14_22040 [Martelella lutilitoris]QRX65285.1 hypothetical protein JS578_13635 [Dysgonomonadaceae bacterium zrk40]
MPIQRQVNFEIPSEHPYANQPELWDCTIQPPPLADPDDPHRLSRSHLQKIELGKSSGSCKVAFVTRLHWSTVLQEFWCASYEESQVYLNLAAHPDTVNFKEQLTRIDYVDDAGKDRHTLGEKRREIDIGDFVEAYAVRMDCDDEMNPFLAKNWIVVDTNLALQRHEVDHSRKRRRPRKWKSQKSGVYSGLLLRERPFFCAYFRPEE